MYSKYSIMNFSVKGFVSGVVWFFLFETYGHSQTNTANGWLVSSHEQELAKGWSLLSDLQIRSADHLQYLETVLIRPAIQYKLNDKHRVALGYAYLGNWERDGPEKGFELEHRAWQQYLVEGKLNKTEVTNRLRLEQSFLQQESDYDFSQRLRYYLRFQVPLSNDKEFKRGAFIGLQNEIFLNIQNKEKVNNNLFDQNRALAGIGYRFSDVLDVEAGYLYRYQIEEEKMHNHILQVTATTSF